MLSFRLVRKLIAPYRSKDNLKIACGSWTAEFAETLKTLKRQSSAIPEFECSMSNIRYRIKTSFWQLKAGRILYWGIWSKSELERMNNSLAIIAIIAMIHSDLRRLCALNIEYRTRNVECWSKGSKRLPVGLNRTRITRITRICTDIFIEYFSAV